MKYKLNIILIIFCLSFRAQSDFYDYPLGYIVKTCEIVLKAPNRNADIDEMIQGRTNYKICYNFIMSLSTTLNSRCINASSDNFNPEEALTYADLSNVNSTLELVMEIINYSKKYPHFINQTAWLHAAKALSQKWPCKLSNN